MGPLTPMQERHVQSAKNEAKRRIDEATIQANASLGMAKTDEARHVVWERFASECELASFEFRLVVERILRGE